MKHVSILLVACFILLVGYGLASGVSDARYNNLLGTYQSHLEEAKVVRNKNKTLSGALNALETDNDDLKSLIAELEARPKEIQYITKTETVLVPSDPIVITPDLPQEHLYTLEDNIVIARFSQDNPGYRFETYALKFRNTMVVSKNRTAASLQIQTSHDPDNWHELPIDVEVNRVSDQKLFEPHVGLGVTTGLPSPDVSGSAYVSLLHPGDNLDVLSLRLSGNQNTASLGVDPVGYNLGAHLPVFTDLWVYGGVGLNTDLQGQVNLTIGSKL
jgi:hypothetical protein